MKENEYEKVIKECIKGVQDNKEIIKKAIKVELNEYGHDIKFDNILKILEESNKIENIKLEAQKIAVEYNGNIEITIKMILAALKNDFKIDLFAESYNIINQTIITLILECMKNCKIENQYINYDEENHNNELIKNQNNYDKIIYIGDYFEYTKFAYFIKQKVYYENFGYIKALIDPIKFKEEYKRLSKECYMRNIFIDFYEDIEEFLEEAKVEDTVIVYTNSEKDKEQVAARLPMKDIYFNEFDFEKYNFKINELIEKLKR